MAPQDFQLVNCVPSVFVDGTGLGAKDTRAGVPDDLRHEERRYTRLGQPTRQRMTQVIDPEILQPSILYRSCPASANIPKRFRWSARISDALSPRQLLSAR